MRTLPEGKAPGAHISFPDEEMLKSIYPRLLMLKPGMSDVEILAILGLGEYREYTKHHSRTWIHGVSTETEYLVDREDYSLWIHKKFDDVAVVRLKEPAIPEWLYRDLSTPEMQSKGKIDIPKDWKLVMPELK